MKIMAGGRLTAASLSVCLLVLAAVTPSLAYQPPAGHDPGGGTTCVSCEPNTVTTSGSATDGSATANENGTQFDISYTVPNDGQMYSGTLMTQVVNADGL